jgi:5-methylcytosine-specific restriction endonuclease McrA
MSRPRIPAALKRLVRQQARARCGYCLTSKALVGMSMEIEHLTPLVSGGETVEDNLWLSCRRCNEYKGT